ncbi:Eukaryotic translation initiation factor 3 subunit D [Ananas comosus]|uniref:Eukaryotic translation initiation factor 3 subunit D n=1 Tax=Ananas comosus TaxID=4615 RepID=A0A199VYU6_ANACO|nr:Eukaryotic translation initiation factor 3 subunit D [Ananas comosus]
MGFDVGVVPFNPDGWGPPDAPAVPPLLPPGSGGGGASTAQPAHVPFAPFSRSEKVGRIADWTRHAAFSNQGKPRGDSTVFDFALDESSSALALASADDDSSFRLVDAKPPPRPKFGPRWRFHQRPQLPQRRDEESSVDIQPEWTMLEQIPFSTFSKLSFSVADPPDDLLVCGALEFYDRSFDRLNPKNERRLERFKSRNFFKVTTTDDPVIRRLAADDKATVFATDAILAALMCAPRSVYSWDIVVQRVGNKLFLDKRDGSQLDLLTVNETASEPLPDAKEDINSPHSLAVEATYINQNFSQQVLVRDGNKLTFDEPNPFAADNEDVASVAYRYRRWKLDDDTYLIARCEVHAVSDVKGQRSFMTLNALNEFDPKYSGVDWRQKLETQRGAVLATELKNNANKLARWTAQALLASADLMKVGYVSRVHPRDHFNHVILGVFGYKPRDFAAQINLNTSNMWGIVKSIVDLCMKLGEGKYVLVKDPIKPQVRIYEVPADAFENDYVEEPLPEEEQVQPPAEDEVDETADIMDAAAEAEANAAAAAAPTSPAAEGGADAEKDASSPAS